MRTIGYSQAVLCSSAASAGPASSVFLFSFASVLSCTVTTLRRPSGERRHVRLKVVNNADTGSLVASQLSGQVSRPQAWPLEKQEHERCACKNEPPLPDTMRGIEEREWAGWQLGGDAAILWQPLGHSVCLGEGICVYIWTVVKRHNHHVNLFLWAQGGEV